MFIDSDDQYYPNTLSTLNRLFGIYGVDAIEFSFTTDINKKMIMEKQDKILSGDEILKYYFLPPFPSQLIWNKAFKKNLYQRTNDNINLATGEDFLFLKCFLINCNKILIINNKLYYYNVIGQDHRSGSYKKELFSPYTFVSLWGGVYYSIICLMDDYSKEIYLKQMAYYLFETIKKIAVNSFSQSIKVLRGFRKDQFVNLVMIGSNDISWKQRIVFILFRKRLYFFLIFIVKIAT